MNGYKLYDLSLKVMEERNAYRAIPTPGALSEFIYEEIKPQEFPEERVYVIALNTKCDVIGYMEHSRGAISSSIISLPKIFQFALLCNANAIAITHNHPSGVITPSEEDEKVTRQINEACKIMQITFLDHIITSPYMDHFSFQEYGKL